MQKLLGSATLILAVTMVVIALPSQIRKNYREKACGLSFFMTLLPFLVYVVRTGYAITIRSWYILIPDSLGVLFSAILLIQYFRYRSHSTPRPSK